MREASQQFMAHISDVLEGIEDDGLYKRERVITSQQFSEIDVLGDDQPKFIQMLVRKCFPQPVEIFIRDG